MCGAAAAVGDGSGEAMGSGPCRGGSELQLGVADDDARLIEKAKRCWAALGSPTASGTDPGLVA